MTETRAPAPTTGEPPEDDRDERITEIGRPEEIDRSEHPVAVAVGMGVLLVLLLIGVVAFGASLSGDDDGGEIEQVVLPRMSGRGLADAQIELERLGLIVEVELDSNEIVPVDVVIDQQPIAGTRIEVGEQVRLRVSDGPAGIDVPDLSGLQGGEAVKLLQTIGLLGVPEAVHDEVVRPGEVVASVPAAGARAAPGATVTVRVSQGPAPRTVPAVVGKSVGEAAVDLARAALAIGEIQEQYSPDQTPGVVVSSAPAPGEQAPRNQPITLVVTSSELPVVVPDVVGLTSASASRVADASGLTPSVRNQELPPGDTR
ncbi:MAG: PASTA domain-containing protein, partial [Microthrixaceae bacterium]